MIIQYLPKHFLIGFNFLLLSLLPGCALFGDAENETVFANLTVFADKNLNPAVDGRASPIVVRIYQLTQTAKFNNSDFFALYENDQTLLAKDLLSRTELEISPNKKYQNQLEIKPNIRFIAVLAAFRDLDTAQWKDITTFSIDENQSLILTLNKNRASLISYTE